jgi:hypothetical protein
MTEKDAASAPTSGGDDVTYEPTDEERFGPPPVWEEDAHEVALAHLEDDFARLEANEDFNYRRTTWYRQNLARYIGTEETPPAFLPRTDGVKLLYAGKAHSFIGAPGSLKTWCAFVACRDFIAQGHNVLYIDCEGSPGPFVRKMSALGVPEEHLLRHVVYVRPNEPLRDNRSAIADLFLQGKHFRPAFLVIDGVTEFMALHDWDINSATDVAKYQKLLLRRFADEVTTVEIDHTAKAYGSTTAIGSQHKRAGIDGVTYLFAKAKSSGVGGRSSVTMKVAKDREGMVLPHCKGDGVAAKFILDGSSGTLVAELEPPPAAEGTDTPLPVFEEQVVELLSEKPMGTKALAAAIGVGAPKVEPIVSALESSGRIVRPHSTAAWRLKPDSPDLA